MSSQFKKEPGLNRTFQGFVECQSAKFLVCYHSYISVKTGYVCLIAWKRTIQALLSGFCNKQTSTKRTYT